MEQGVLAQLGFKDLVHHLRVGLALHGLHRLADEEAEQRFLAALYCSTLSALSARILSTSASIAPVSDFLLKPLALDDRAGGIAGFQHDFQHLLGDRAGDRAVADQRQQFRRPFQALPGDSSSVLPSLLSAPNSSEISQLAACLATSAGSCPAALRRLGQQQFEPARGLDLGGQHRGVVGRQAQSLS